MSGGRVELGIGAGWYEAEHAAYGFEFPDTAARFDRLTDQLAIIEGLWNTPVGETFSYTGKVHSVTDSPGLPKPAQQTVPIIIGGGGPKRTPELAARYATEYNVAFQSAGDVRRTAPRESPRRARRSIARRPIRYSAALVVCAAPSEAEIARRAAAIGRAPDDLRMNGAAGSADETAATLRRFIDAGAQRIYLQVLDLSDLDHLDFIAGEVAALLG